MTELEGFSYAVFGVYALTSAGLTAAAAKLGLRQTAARGPILAWAALVAAGAWPLLRLALGNVATPDVLQHHLDGLTGDLVGHALLAAGALGAMMAEVQILTRARVAAISAAEAPAGPFAHGCVAAGRVVQLTGLFLVFPSLVLCGLTVAATAMIIGVRSRQRLP